jgi:hypothetical protein
MQPQHIVIGQQHPQHPHHQHPSINPFDFNPHYVVPDSPGFPGMTVMSPVQSPHPQFASGGMASASPVDIQQHHHHPQQQQFDPQAPNSPFGGGGSFNGSQYSHSSSLPIHAMHNIAHHPQRSHESFTAGSLGGSFHNEPLSYTEEAIFQNPATVMPCGEGVDKRRKRRESHNAVERRRRDNINDKIQVCGCPLMSRN